MSCRWVVIYFKMLLIQVAKQKKKTKNNIDKIRNILQKDPIHSETIRPVDKLVVSLKKHLHIKKINTRWIVNRTNAKKCIQNISKRLLVI